VALWTTTITSRRAARLSAHSGYSDASEDLPGSSSASPRAGGRASGAGISSGDGGAAAAAAAAARVAAYAAGSAPGLPLHTAWQHLLGSFLPFLLDEADFAADLFLMRT
jgi:hypothetical protein